MFFIKVEAHGESGGPRVKGKAGRGGRVRAAAAFAGRTATAPVRAARRSSPSRVGGRKRR